MMRKIYLTQNKVALVDDVDYSRLNKHKWFASKHRNTYYAARNIRVGCKWTILFMHQAILKIPPGLITDHKNHNGLDNRGLNLRAVTNAENQWNTQYNYSGATWYEKDKKWAARIRHKGKRIWLGLFKTKIAAENAYDKARTDLRPPVFMKGVV